MTVLLCNTSVMSEPMPLQVRSRILDEGAILAIALRENTVLIGAGTQFLVLDATNVRSLDTLGKLATPGEIRSIFVKDTLAFVANAEAGLSIVDFSNVREPQIIGSVQARTRVFDVHVEGNVAYVADKGSGLDIYDISDPRVPVLLSHYHMFDSDDGNGLISVFVSRGRAYLGDLVLKTIVNVENPSFPYLVRQIPGPAWSIEIEDTIAYVSTNSEQNFRTYSIAAPDTMILLDWISATPNDVAPTLEFAVSNGRAYIGCEQAGLSVIDVSDPYNLEFVGEFDPDSLELDVHGVIATDTVVLFVSYSHGVFSFVPSDSGAIVAEQVYDAGDAPLRLESAGTRLFVANYYDGVTEVDIQDIGRPIQLWESRNTGRFGYTEGVFTFFRDSVPYIVSCDHDAGIRIFDVSDEHHPVVTDSLIIPDAKAVSVMGDFAYVCGGTNLHIVDISSVFDIHLIRSLYAGGNTVNLAAEDGFVYVAVHSFGLNILDARNPGNASFVSDYREGVVYDVDVVYPYVYLAMPDSGLTVLNVSTLPPTVEGRTAVVGAPNAISVNENLAFIASRYAGLRVVDITHADSAYEVAYCSGIGEAGYLNVLDASTEFETRKTACVSALNGGLSFIDVSGLFDSTRTSLIIAGGGNGSSNFEYFISNTNPSTNFGYTVLSRSRNYGRRVAYLNPQAWQDLDGDGEDDASVSSSLATPLGLRQQILSLRDSRDPDRPNVIYFSGHGHFDEIDINGDLNDNVRADSLGAWIDQAGLDGATPLVIILEACNAGSLIEELSIGRDNRVFIASGGSDDVSNFWEQESFSTKFWEGVWNGRSLWASFESARSWVNEHGQQQNPILDANGDGRPNEFSDRVIADEIYLGGRTQGGATLPVILDSPIGVDVFGDSALVEIVCNGAMENVWYRIYPVDGLGEPELLHWGLMRSVGSNRYRALMTGLSDLTSQENYLIEFNALDDFVNLALPRVATLRKDGGAPEPLPMPEKMALQSYPNPFNSMTRITFHTTAQAHVLIDIWNILGQKVSTLVDEVYDPGIHNLNWAAKTDSGVTLASGVYFVRMSSVDNLLVTKLLLIR